MSDVTRDQVQQAIRSITCDVMNYQPPAKAGSDTSLLNGKLTDRICELFDVDDPVEAKAKELAQMAYPHDPDVWERLIDSVRDMCRRIAAAMGHANTREWTIFGETDGEEWGIGITFGTREEAEEYLRRETWIHNKGGYIVSRTISEWEVTE